MVNTQYLEEKIDASGKKKDFLAKKCGLSRTALYNKINGKNEFSESQASVLCKELGITTIEERRKIFCL